MVSQQVLHNFFRLSELALSLETYLEASHLLGENTDDPWSTYVCPDVGTTHIMFYGDLC